MEKSYPIIRVLIVIVLVAGIAFWYKSKHPSSNLAQNNQTPPAQQITVTGLVGGEKLGYITDPQVTQILRDKYGITINASKSGSLDMVKQQTGANDFLWPSSQVALELYKEQDGKMKKSDTIFSSPMVLYSWTPVVDALIKIKVVQKIGDAYYIVDFPKLINLIKTGKRWKDIGLPDLYGKVTIRTTDPNKSNSGMMFSGLLANIVNNDVVTEQTLPKVKPVVVSFFNSMGYMESGSGDLFDQFITQGEGQNPIIVGYENQLTEFIIAHPDYRDTINNQIKILYPRPTVWSDHPLIALNDNGVALMDALQKDPDLKKLAWEQHGFRTGLHNDPSVLKVTGIPATISNVVPMPKPKVMDSLLAAIGKS